MEDFVNILPGDLPAWAYVTIALIILIGIIAIAKLTSNSNKQSMGSKNIFSGDTKINQQIGRDITNHENKDEP
ncbi:hypothetical protein [Psychrobacter sanguinis]|uniref:hypothetical protein n=1 Tax=Psychrobacter sanguinis TaxID=861445 RepID=UPI0019189711|nr:hypothetical protein [Psychrobacter sanguinis]MCC3307496.1 hypothetical protein [Psychrobacter sanguinis]UEC24828.1 hypothetical protein LK453_09795 [Psychrobacter sanguinis]